MSAGVAVQAVVTGLSIGAVYALVAVGFTLVYGLTRVYLLAQGDIIIASVFLGVLVVIGTTPVARDPGPGTAFGLAVVTVLGGALLSAGVYAVAVRPFILGREAGSGATIGWVAGGIAAGLALRAVVGLVFTAQAYAVPDPLHLSGLTHSGVVHLPGGTTVPVRVFGVLAIGVVVAVAVQFALVRGRTGRALRAVATDPETASLVGVSVDRVVLIAFLVAGVLAGLAGLLYAPGQSVTVDAGVILGLKGILAAYLGRLGSLGGAVVGGLALGVGESLATSWSALGAAYSDVLPLALLVVVIAVRPEGLRGPVRDSAE